MATKNLSDQEPLPPIGSARDVRKSVESGSESGDSEQDSETEIILRKSRDSVSDDEGSRGLYLLHLKEWYVILLWKF